MKNRENMYFDIHIIQTVPPSCVNRDDTGSPKTCIYGGVRRARVSSQSWKRAIRLSFRDMYTQEDLSNRTMRIVGMVEEQIKCLNDKVDAKDLTKKVLESAGIKLSKKDPEKAEAMFFMSVAQAKALADIAVNSPEKITDKNVCKAALKEKPSIDMALFGRMVASDPSLNYDAAAMVAHSISTHKVQTEFDYFTAVDDLSPEETSGAGHLGTVEFNSSTLYRYASVNVMELYKNLKDATPMAVRDFAEALILSMPTGKINTFANFTLPNAVYVTVRKDQPVNLSPAFERPVPVDEGGGYVSESKKALVKYAKTVYDSFAEEPVKAWTVGEGIEELGNKVNIKTMLTELENYIAESLVEVE